MKHFISSPSISCLQGILADGALVELVLDKLLNRYLLMSLRANLNEVESVAKSKQVRAETDWAGLNIYLLLDVRSWSSCLSGGSSRGPRS